MPKYVIIYLFSVFISSISQIILKKSALRTYDSKIKEYINVMVISAYIIFFGSSLLTAYAFRGVHLSLGPVLESSGYLYIVILSSAILKEKITRKKLLGNMLILCGIFTFAFLK